MNNTSLDITEFENLMALDNPIQTSKATRWERKLRQQQTQQPSDRFIPNRSGMESSDENFGREDASFEATSDHAKLLLENTAEVSKSSRVLAFKNKAPAPVEGYQNTLKVLFHLKLSG